MSGVLMWICVVIGTGVLLVLGWFAMNTYGAWAKRRDELERQQLQEEWKRRAAERKAKDQGGVPAPEGQEESGDNPPMY